MFTVASRISFSLLALCMAACSTTAPKYTANFDNISALRSQQLAPVKVGTFTKESGAKKDVDKLTIRGGSYVSPYGSFTEYLQELDDARLLDASADTEVTGVLLRNELDASGVAKAYAEVEARFVVRRGGTVKYEGTKTARYDWDSNFVGAIAIPRANQNYPVVIQKLLTVLVSDPAFIAALKK
jgi:hypothetical protein